MVVHYNFYDEITYMEPSAPVPYQLEYFDRQSIKEIRNMVLQGAYHDPNTVSEHLLFLEHLVDRLQQIVANEQSAGVSTLMLKDNITEIKSLRAILHSILENFSSAS
jgi:hypothetical protein